MDKQKSIDLLNAAVGDELPAIHQYMYFHFHLDDQGFGPLAMLFKRTAIEEMGHVELLAERILFLNGVPTTKPDTKVEKTDEIEKMLEVSEALEQQAVDMYNAAAITCSAEGDQVSKKLFEELLAEEEEHLDFFQNTQAHIQKMGKAYLVTLVGDDE